MKKHILMILIVVALALSACAPAAPAVQAAETESPVLGLTQDSPAVVNPPATEAPVDAAPSSVLAVATSRGDKLHATDPASVRIGAGKPVLIEFFRFT